MSITVKKENSPFVIEDLRNELALKKDFVNLKKTYDLNYPEIEDYNSSKFWDKLNQKFGSELKNNPMARDRLRWVADYIRGNAKDNSIILNVGFGSCELEKQLLYKENYIWSGVDISSKSVKNASEKFPSANFSLGNLNDLVLTNNRYDYVILLEVLEHIKPRKTLKVLSKIYEALKVGGKIIVSVPLNEGLEEMINNAQNPNAHLRVYTPTLIVAELQISGFQVIKQRVLYAFNSFYILKSIFVNILAKGFRLPNDIIIIARKK